MKSTIQSVVFCATCVLVLCSAIGLSSCRPSTTTTPTIAVTNTVTLTVTNTVDHYFTNTVTDVVTNFESIPLPIPADYVAAMDLLTKLTNATYVGEDQVLFNLKNVRVEYHLDDDIQKVITEDDVKARFELTLRQYNVPIDPDSKNVLIVTINGFFDPSQELLSDAFQCELDEVQLVCRGGEWHSASVRVWSKGDKFGYAGRDVANAQCVKTVQSLAEVFANDYLTANPAVKSN